MNHFLLLLEASAYRLALASLIYVLGQLTRQVSHLRALAVTLVILATVFLSFGVGQPWVVALAVVALALGMVTRLSVATLSTVYLLHLGVVLVFLVVHFENVSNFLSMNPLALRSLSALSRFAVFIVIVVAVATPLTHLVLRLLGKPRAAATFWALILGSLCGYLLVPFLGLVVILSTGIGLFLGNVYSASESNGLLAPIGARHPVPACMTYLVLYGFALASHHLTAAWVFSPSEVGDVVVTMGMTLSFGAVLGTLARRRHAQPGGGPLHR
jgi:hypothetical protein